MTRTADRLWLSQGLLGVALGLVLLGLLLPIGHAVLAGTRDTLQARQLARVLGTQQLSLLPAGRAARPVPGARSPALDLRHSPMLPVVDPDPARLLLPADRDE